MPSLETRGPIVWAIAIGIVLLCSAMSYSAVTNCREVHLELFSALKSSLGSCTPAELTGAPDMELAARIGLPDADARGAQNAAPVTASDGGRAPDTVDFSALQIGRTYALTDLLDPDSFHAPLYKDKPGKFGGLARVVGQLFPNERFTVTATHTTGFFNYRWIGLKLADAGPSAPTVWLPWGARETPLTEVPN